MNWTAVALGGLAGFTIFLGLPVAFLKNLSQRVRAFLTAMSTGILVFLLVEITYKVIENIEDLTLSATEGYPRWGDVLVYSGLFAVGLFIGLMGLVWFERLFIKSAKDKDITPVKNARRVSLMIAMGIGLHNFSEGLAIGQAYSWGNSQLAWLLVVGFALHNATEGFGIVGPLSGHPASWGFIGLMGLIGGTPTLLGSLIGSFWTLKPLEVFFLSMASGSILYVVGELLHLGRKLKDESTAATGLLAGFFLAFITEVLITIASGGVQGS
jgi:zinc transporter, ZIP family